MHPSCCRYGRQCDVDIHGRGGHAVHRVIWQAHHSATHVKKGEFVFFASCTYTAARTCIDSHRQGTLHSCRVWQRVPWTTRKVHCLHQVWQLMSNAPPTHLWDCVMRECQDGANLSGIQGPVRDQSCQNALQLASRQEWCMVGATEGQQQHTSAVDDM